MKKPLFVLFCCLSATLVVSESFAQRFVRRSLDRACVQAAQLDSELTDTTLYPTSLDRAGALEVVEREVGAGHRVERLLEGDR